MKYLVISVEGAGEQFLARGLKEQALSVDSPQFGFRVRAVEVEHVDLEAGLDGGQMDQLRYDETAEAEGRV
jgi:hypothetical protein